jgi:hypothetical protein
MDDRNGEKRLIEGVMDAARPGWRERRARRKSPWNLVGMLVALPVMGLAWYGLWLFAWQLHLLFYPAHAGHVREFWRAGISGRALISSFLMLMPLFVPAIAVGLLLSNCLMWLIPPARRAMEAEAAGDEEMTFRGANRGLVKVGAIASVVALLLALIGAATLSRLR